MAGLYRLNELEQQISDDRAWARTAPEVQQHDGKFVMVHRKRVIAVGDDEVALRAEAAKAEKCPEYEVVSVFIYPPELSEIPH